MHRKGFGDPFLLKFAVALVALSEVHFSQYAKRRVHDPHELLPARDVASFTNDMLLSLEHMEPAELDEVSDDNLQLRLWADVFKLHCILRR